MPPPRHFWEELFAPAEAGEGGGRLQMLLLKKGGRPFLLLPDRPRPAVATLALYPAQTLRARAARALWRWLLRMSLPAGTQRVWVSTSPTDPFAVFLSAQAGGRSAGLPVLGILAGNPLSDGQRFLVLAFDAQQRPVAVVKAGLSEQAKAFIEQEARFLAAVPANTSAVPRLRAKFESPRLRALALDFFPGDSPRARHEAALPALLAGWVDTSRTIALGDTASWRQLEQAASARPLFSVLAGPLGGRLVHPAIEHGDFAPWNVKVSPAGAWTVLDWERGQLAGIPAWDWFHYVIQSAILVARLPTAALALRVETLLSSEAFRQYAVRAGIARCERELVLAYLLRMVEVIKPSEGLVPAEQLLQALAARWGKA